MFYAIFEGMWPVLQRFSAVNVAYRRCFGAKICALTALVLFLGPPGTSLAFLASPAEWLRPKSGLAYAGVAERPVKASG